MRPVSRQEKDLAKFAQGMEQLAEGRLNSVGTVTLAAGVTTTTVKSPTCSPGSNVHLTPQTANAAGALATTYFRPVDVTSGQFIITHANAATVDRTFGYSILGPAA